MVCYLLHVSTCTLLPFWIFFKMYFLILSAVMYFYVSNYRRTLNNTFTCYEEFFMTSHVVPCNLAALHFTDQKYQEIWILLWMSQLVKPNVRVAGSKCIWHKPCIISQIKSSGLCWLHSFHFLRVRNVKFWTLWKITFAKSWCRKLKPFKLSS